MATQTLSQLSTAPLPDAAINITAKTVCLMLRFGAIGTERKVRDSQIHERGNPEEIVEDGEAPVDIDADKNLVRVSKKLIVSKELDAIRQERRKLKRWLETVAVPSFLKEGIYRVPVKSATKVAKALEDFVPKDKERVEAFLNVYKQRCDETAARLKALGEIADYPPVSKVRAAFYVDWQWTSFETPSKLKEISQEFFEQAEAQANAKLVQATDAITLLMRQQLKELVDHMADALKPGEDGKAKRFHKTTVTKLKDFLAEFRDRNVTDDQQLEIIVKSAEQLLEGVDVEQIKTNEAVKANTALGLSMVKQCLDGLVEEAGSRQITFGEYE